MDQNLVKVIISQFRLQKYQNRDIDISDYGLKDLEDLLAKRIKYLMDYDWDWLMTSLYRIDIDEESVKRIFKYSKSDLIPGRIAHLIIARTIEKLKNY